MASWRQRGIDVPGGRRRAYEVSQFVAVVLLRRARIPFQIMLHRDDSLSPRPLGLAGRLHFLRARIHRSSERGIRHRKMKTKRHAKFGLMCDAANEVLEELRLLSQRLSVLAAPAIKPAI